MSLRSGAMTFQFALVYCFLSLQCVFAELDLANWMGQLAPVIKDATLLDLSLPGAHDAMTSDLSTTLSDGYEGLGPVISKILHAVSPEVAGRFIRENGQTQGLDLVSMLDSGVRFVDFRVMYTDAPSKSSGKDWYCLHGCQTRQTAKAYLQKARQWLDEHPTEIVVFWCSRHGNTDATGTQQYPNTTPAQRQAFFKDVESTFHGLLFDSSTSSLNETSVSTLLQNGHRVIWYAADYVESTSSSALALDARLIHNELPGAGPDLGSLNSFRKGAATLASDKASNKFYLMSLASSGAVDRIKYAAEITFLPFGKSSNREKCAKSCGIPGMTDWCPMSLQEYGQMVNYYNQRILDAVYLEGDREEAVDFPNAIYIDGLDHGGLIRTGTDRINPLAGSSEGDHGTTGYAYSATVIGATLRRFCRHSTDSVRSTCATLGQSVQESRAKSPVSLWNDATHGRLTNWPVIPNSAHLVV